MMQSRPGPQRQQGFGLLAFVVGLAFFAMSLVFGYSGLMTKEQLSISKNQKAEYMEEVLARMSENYRPIAFDMDSNRGNSITNADILAYLNVPRRWDLQVEKSNLLTSPEGLQYRNYAFWLDMPEEYAEPMNIANFKATGKMVCGGTGEACDPSYYLVTWTSLDIGRSMVNETEKALERVVKKAQVYFKARQLLDPERSVSVNYFYKPSNVCATPNSIDLGCLDTYTNLATVNSNGSITRMPFATHLALSDSDLTSGWGLPIQISAVEDAEHELTPYTLAIRAMKPDGTFIKKSAIQQF